jgi:uncharacterized protein (DUF2141 family)
VLEALALALKEGLPLALPVALAHRVTVLERASRLVPLVTVEIPGHRTKSGAATVAVLGLESSYLGSEEANGDAPEA